MYSQISAKVNDKYTSPKLSDMLFFVDPCTLHWFNTCLYSDATSKHSMSNYAEDFNFQVIQYTSVFLRGPLHWKLLYVPNSIPESFSELKVNSRSFKRHRLELRAFQRHAQRSISSIELPATADGEGSLQWTCPPCHLPSDQWHLGCRAAVASWEQGPCGLLVSQLLWIPRGKAWRGQNTKWKRSVWYRSITFKRCTCDSTGQEYLGRKIWPIWSLVRSPRLHMICCWSGHFPPEVFDIVHA